MKRRDLSQKPTSSGGPNKKSRICVDFSDGVGLQMTILSLAARPFRVRASSIIAIAHLHSQSKGGSRNFPDKEVIQSPGSPESWFVKVVATIFVRSRSLDSCVGYLRENLSPWIAFEVVRRFENSPNLGLRFLEFGRSNLSVSHSFWTYNLLLRSLCLMGLHDSAQMVFDYMRSDGHLPDSLLLGFLVTSFARARKFHFVKKLVVEVPGGEINIPCFVYNNLFSLLIKHNLVDEAISLFKEHLAVQSPPDTWTFNILIGGLCKVGAVHRAFQFFTDMPSFGCIPDIVTYNTLIDGFCKVNEVDRGHELLEEVKSRIDCSADVKTYTSLISGFSKLGKMEESSILFEEMISWGIKPTIVTFNVLIDGFGKIGNMDFAEATYEKIFSFSCQPDVVTFTNLIKGYCCTGQVNIGLKLWDVMKGRNVSPNVYTYSIIIHSLCKENRLHEARDFLRQLKHSDIIPKPFIYNPVIDGFCKAGNVDEANVIVEEMEDKKCKPDKVTFTILIIGHCAKGRMFESIDIFNKMLAIGCAPDSVTMSSLISCLLKAGMPSEASRIVQMASEDLNLGLSSFQKSIPSRTSSEIPVAM